MPIDEVTAPTRGITAVRREHRRIVIAGGGVAAIETLLALRALARARAHITLISARREFHYRPVTVAEAFEQGEARTYDLGAILAEQGGEFVWGTVARVEDRVAITAAGQRVPFDMLVIATGARARVPFPGALTFEGRRSVPALRGLLAELRDGSASSVAFALPSERVWPVPLYELALLTSAHLHEHGVERVSLAIVTPEPEPLAMFGVAASEALSSLLNARRITIRSSSSPAFGRDRELVLVGGETVPADRVITVPLPTGHPIAGVPHDRNGFIAVDAHGRVDGLEGVYAAGDCTAFALKQGGLAAQQADAVAQTIAVQLGATITPAPFRPVLRGLLMTGGAPLYLRAEPNDFEPHLSAVLEPSSAFPDARPSSTASDQPLWWPPAKIAGRYLAPYLASAHPRPLASAALADRAPIPGPPLSDVEHQQAVDLTLALADCDARAGDYNMALAALDAAQALAGALAPEYEVKRSRWEAAAQGGS